MKRFLVPTVLVALVFVTGCYYDNEEYLYPTVTACDTASVSYAQHLVPILNSRNCLGCHNASLPSDNVNLDSHDGLAANIDRVIGAVSHAPGFTPMPQGSTNPLPPCEINRFRAWRNQGMQNN